MNTEPYRLSYSERQRRRLVVIREHKAIWGEGAPGCPLPLPDIDAAGVELARAETCGQPSARTTPHDAEQTTPVTSSHDAAKLNTPHDAKCLLLTAADWDARL